VSLDFIEMLTLGDRVTLQHFNFMYMLYTCA